MKQILLVENHVALRECLSGILVEWGYTVEAAGNAADGLMHARAARVSLYLIDVGLPDGNGIELCRQIRTFDSSTPIVIYSGDEYFEASAIEAGAQAFIIMGEDLTDRLRQELLRLVETQRERPELGHSSLV